MTLFITRPRPDAERTCAVLAEAGINAAPAPLMRIEPTGTPLPETDSDTVLAFTSANGVRAWQERAGANRPAFVVGEATARAAEDAGLYVEAIAGGDVDQLFALLQEKAAGRSILHVRGVHGTGDLARRLKETGLKAEAAELYEAKAVTSLPADLAKAVREGSHAIGVFSPRTMRLFVDLASDAGLKPALANMTAYCLSQAVAEARGNTQFGHVEVAEAPQLAAFVDMVQSRRT